MNFHMSCGFPPEGGGGLPMMAYTERLRPKGVPFPGFLQLLKSING